MCASSVQCYSTNGDKGSVRITTYLYSQFWLRYVRLWPWLLPMALLRFFGDFQNYGDMNYTLHHPQNLPPGCLARSLSALPRSLVGWLTASKPQATWVRSELATQPHHSQQLHVARGMYVAGWALSSQPRAKAKSAQASNKARRLKLEGIEVDGKSRRKGPEVSGRAVSN
jgi:hypothetical protein